MVSFDPSVLRQGERCAVCGQPDPVLLRVYRLRGLQLHVPAETVLCHHHAMPLVDLCTRTADGALVLPTRRRVLELWQARRAGRTVLVGEERRSVDDRRSSRRAQFRERRRAVR